MKDVLFLFGKHRVTTRRWCKFLSMEHRFSSLFGWRPTKRYFRPSFDTSKPIRFSRFSTWINWTTLTFVYNMTISNHFDGKRTWNFVWLAPTSCRTKENWIAKERNMGTACTDGPMDERMSENGLKIKCTATEWNRGRMGRDTKDNSERIDGTDKERSLGLIDGNTSVRVSIIFERLIALFTFRRVLQRSSTWLRCL